MADGKYGQKWSEDETTLTYFYYCQIPFGKIHKENPEIIRIANMLGRTPSSVVFKMGNLGHFDPELRKRNVSGLSNASKTDAEIVQRFNDNWEALAFKAKKIEDSLLPVSEEITTPIGAEREQLIQARVNQQFFHETVLSSYQQSCCITGIAIPTLLIASHIKPWAVSDPGRERTNPSNGLCLNALHDKAFDKGLITVLPNYTVRISSQLKKNNNADRVAWLIQCDKQKMRLPEKFLPAIEFLEYHNDAIFIP